MGGRTHGYIHICTDNVWTDRQVCIRREIIVSDPRSWGANTRACPPRMKSPGHHFIVLTSIYLAIFQLNGSLLSRIVSDNKNSMQLAMRTGFDIPLVSAHSQGAACAHVCPAVGSLSRDIVDPVHIARYILSLYTKYNNSTLISDIGGKRQLVLSFKTKTNCGVAIINDT